MLQRAFNGYSKSRLLMKAVSSARSTQQSRSIMWLMYSILNRPDSSRIKEVGPDLSCAEWLVRCGALPKFERSETYIKDYNQLAKYQGTSPKLVEVVAEEARIMLNGFVHFDGCSHIRKVSIRRCAMFDDSCLDALTLHLSKSLRELEVHGCDISGEGLARLSNAKNLTQLSLLNLLSVNDGKAAFDQLKLTLPKCQIDLSTSSGFSKSTIN